MMPVKLNFTHSCFGFKRTLVYAEQRLMHVGRPLPRDAASAMVQQIVAEGQPREAAVAMMTKPKPKARIRGAVRTPTAAEAAAAAAAAATAGLWDNAPAPTKAPKKPAQGEWSILS